MEMIQRMKEGAGSGFPMFKMEISVERTGQRRVVKKKLGKVQLFVGENILPYNS